jgi:hypothetical protein
MRPNDPLVGHYLFELPRNATRHGLRSGPRFAHSDLVRHSGRTGRLHYWGNDGRGASGYVRWCLGSCLAGGSGSETPTKSVSEKVYG